MKRYPLLVALAGLMLTSSVLIMAATSSQPSQGPVYSVAQVAARLTSRPRGWAGRTVLLRGVAVRTGCQMDRPDTLFVCPQAWAVLADADPAAAGRPLPLARAGPDPLLVMVRRMPVLGSLAPAPQLIHWDAVATYRVELRAMPDAGCRAAHCYEALLLDAAP